MKLNEFITIGELTESYKYSEKDIVKPKGSKTQYEKIVFDDDNYQIYQTSTNEYELFRKHNKRLMFLDRSKYRTPLVVRTRELDGKLNEAWKVTTTEPREYWEQLTDAQKERFLKRVNDDRYAGPTKYNKIKNFDDVSAKTVDAMRKNLIMRFKTQQEVDKDVDHFIKDGKFMEESLDVVKTNRSVMKGGFTYDHMIADAFGVKNRDVKIDPLKQTGGMGINIISVYLDGKWVDYDVIEKGDDVKFIKAM